MIVDFIVFFLRHLSKNSGTLYFLARAFLLNFPSVYICFSILWEVLHRCCLFCLYCFDNMKINITCMIKHIFNVTHSVFMSLLLFDYRTACSLGVCFTSMLLQDLSFLPTTTLLLCSAINTVVWYWVW